MSAADLAASMRGKTVRLHVWPHIASGGIVAVAHSHDAASPGALLDGEPEMHCLLTHDPDVRRPDAKGRALMAEVLARGGTALLNFESLSDAADAAAWCRAMAEGGAA